MTGLSRDVFKREFDGVAKIRREAAQRSLLNGNDVDWQTTEMT